VVLQVATLFWNLAYEQARVASLETLEAQTSDLVATVSQRVEKDDARPVERVRAEIELEKVLGELAAARESLAARQAQLGLWLGVPRDKRLVAVTDLGALPVARNRATQPATPRTTPPALLASRARSRVLEAEVEVEQMGRVPSFSLTGFTTHGLDVRGYGASMAVDLPLWNWNTGRIAQAEAKLASARKQAEATALAADTALVGAEAACSASVRTATRLRNNVLPRSEAAALTTERTYQLGEASLLEVLDARRTLLEARRLFLGALAQAQIDCSRLGVLGGEEAR
jgi:cobalt-zinc-cadmium efflux system outer membrane protein